MSIKTIKLKKKHYSNLEQLLRDAGLVEENEAKPWNLFVNKKTYKLITQEITKAYKKEFPYVNTNKLKSSVAMYMLNLAPSINDGVKDGYGIIKA
jgi:hypothetical protein